MAILACLAHFKKTLLQNGSRKKVEVARYLYKFIKKPNTLNAPVK
jgi:hypothetical protein